MTQNPWGSPDNGQTNPWQTAPQQMPPSPPQRPSTSGGAVAAAVAAVVIVVALLVVGAVWFLQRDKGDTDATAAPSFTATAGGDGTATPPVVSGTDEPAPAPTPTAGSGSGSGPSTGGGSSSGGSSPGNGSGSGSGGGASSGAGGGSVHSSDDLPSGLDYSGWSGYPSASCNSSDTWVYAGGNGDAKVVVCRVGSAGDFYYRGYAGGQGLELDVDMSTADVADGYFEIPANPSTIVIDGDTVTVYDRNGTASKRHDFDGNAWVDTDA